MGKYEQKTLVLRGCWRTTKHQGEVGRLYYYTKNPKKKLTHWGRVNLVSFNWFLHIIELKQQKIIENMSSKEGGILSLNYLNESDDIEALDKAVNNNLALDETLERNVSADD